MLSLCSVLYSCHISKEKKLYLFRLMCNAGWSQKYIKNFVFLSGTVALNWLCGMDSQNS